MTALLTTSEAARQSGSAVQYVQRCCLNGSLRATRSEDGSYRIDPADLARWMDERRMTRQQHPWRNAASFAARHGRVA